MIAAKASLVNLVPGVDKSPVVVGVEFRLIKLTWGQLYTSILHQKKQRAGQKRPVPRDSF